ncbi:unnamed protein product [Closterium sp. Naga37s-1]|nr:unnamed protein product [Closterium sp. Naga37s-1]
MGFNSKGISKRTTFNDWFIPRSGLERAGIQAGSIWEFKEGMGKAAPRLLETVMKVDVVTPEDHSSDVIGDLNSRRGQVNSFGDKLGGMKCRTEQLPQLLEPVIKVEVVMPEDHMGDNIGDLISRRRQINSFGDKPGGMKVVDALVPLSEMFNYVSNLRGMTKGHGDPQQSLLPPSSRLSTFILLFRCYQVVDALVPLSEMFNYVSNLRGMTKGRANYNMQLTQFDIVPTNI